MKKTILALAVLAIGITSCGGGNPVKGKVFASDQGYTIAFNQDGRASISGGGYSATYNVSIERATVYFSHPYSDSRLTGTLSGDKNSITIEPGSITFNKL